VLLDQSHTADVRALERSTFRVAEAAGLLRDDPALGLQLASLLARRLDLANRALVEVRRQLEAGQPRSVVGQALERLGKLVRYGSDRDPERAWYVYAPWG
jgi:CRP/FNR family transcriptional regulator, cyclic AMP receptor protein